MTPVETSSKQREGGSLLSLPAAQALIVQGLAFVISCVSLFLIKKLSGHQITIFDGAIAQGVVAFVITRMRKMAAWWAAIQFIFPLAILAASSLDLPPIIFLLAFLLLLGFYWTVFRTRVPLYLSGAEIWKSVSDLMPSGKFRFVDMGSGFGGLLFHLEKHHPVAELLGVELAPIPWLVSTLRALISGSHVRFMRSDYMSVDLSQFDVVFAYLSPAVMDVVWQKAFAEMRPGALLISYEFPIVEVAPDSVVQNGRDGSLLYVWRMPDLTHK